MVKVKCSYFFVNTIFIFILNNSILVISIKYNIHGKYASNNKIFKFLKCFHFGNKGKKVLGKTGFGFLDFRAKYYSGKNAFGNFVIREKQRAPLVVDKTDSKTA